MNKRILTVVLAAGPRADARGARWTCCAPRWSGSKSYRRPSLTAITHAPSHRSYHWGMSNWSVRHAPTAPRRPRQTAWRQEQAHSWREGRGRRPRGPRELGLAAVKALRRPSPAMTRP